MGKITTQLVVTGLERRGRPKAIQPGNREWVTAIAAINAAGWSVPPFLIFAGQYHLSAWYEEAEIPRDWVIAVSDNGWTNNKLGVEWLKHFNAHTKTRVVGARRLLPRVLICDGFGSHETLEILEFCLTNNIILCRLPSHTSHKLQPCNVGPFAPLKTAYRDQVERLSRGGVDVVGKEHF
ncbi:CENP-B protein, partial [Didymella exigua CBS 183.55]